MRSCATPRRTWPARWRAPQRVGVWALSVPETCVAVIGALLAGVAAVPINPKAGERELGHIVDDSRARDDPVRARRRAAGRAGRACRASTSTSPRAVATSRPSPTRRPRRSSSTPRARPGRPRAPSCRAARSPRTSTRWPTRGSGRPTTSSPTGCRSSTSTAWSSACSARSGAAAPRITWGASPRRGSPPRSSRARRWSSACRRCTTAWSPTPRTTPRSRRRCGSARLLVSGSAALPAADHERIERLSGQRIVERYGMSETLMNTSVRADGDRRAGYVGPPLDGVEIRLLDDAASPDRRRRRRDDRRDRGARAQPLPGVPQPPRRDRRGAARRLVSHRRPRHARARRLHPHRRAPRHRPHQERRLQDRRGRDRGRAARAPRRARGGGHRRARPRPRRAHRRLDRAQRGRLAVDATSWPTTSHRC